MKTERYQSPEEKAVHRENRKAYASLVIASEMWMSTLEKVMDLDNLTCEEDMAFIICDMKAEAEKLERTLGITGHLRSLAQWEAST